MDKCPKCNCTKINGPYYMEAQQSVCGFRVDEYLKYICDRCGYSATGPCADSKEATISEVQK